MATSGGGGLLVRQAALLILAVGCALTSCGDWISIGTYLQCGVACEPIEDIECGELGTQYNLAGKCVCARDADCLNYPCTLPDESQCFIAGYDGSGTCICLAKLTPGACGQPCSPVEVPLDCPSQRFEWNESGDCACAPAACPCGRVCPASPNASCLLLQQYNRQGECVCAPVVCPDCEGRPCCSDLCGADCTIEGCDDDGSESCVGFCNKKNECVKGTQSCSEVP